MKIHKIFLQILCVGLLAATHIFSQTAAPKVYWRAAVTDKKGGIVQNLDKNDFKVYEGGVERDVDSVKLDDAPASVLILMDVSGSLTDRVRRGNANAAVNFILAAHPQNDYSIIAFSTAPAELADWGSNGKKLVESLTGIAALKGGKGNTALYDAVSAAQEKFKTAKNEKRILLIFSDGGDNSSKNSFDKIVKAVKTDGFTVYTIGNFDGSSQLETMQGQAFLERLSNLSGGRAFFAQSENELEEAAKLVAHETKSFYLIGYSSKESRKKNEWRDVEIKAADEQNRRLTVRARKGYFKDQN